MPLAAAVAVAAVAAAAAERRVTAVNAKNTAKARIIALTSTKMRRLLLKRRIFNPCPFMLHLP
jgi:hypothetical protein